METAMQDTHATAPLGEERIREIEARANDATKTGSLSLPAMLALRDIPALIASHRALQRAVLEWQTIADGPTARRQFPDGSVPGNSEQAAAGWMRLYEAEYDKGRALAREVERLTKERDEANGRAFRWAELAGLSAAERDTAEAKAAALEARVAEMAEVLTDVRDAGYLKDNALWRRVASAIKAAALTHPPQPQPGDGVDPEPADDMPGWSFWNPDSGQEWLPEDTHPVDSGECDDAENVVPMTYGAFLAAYCPNLRKRPVPAGLPATEGAGDDR
jgi:hypothetical protein